jgi:prevent-host-death family protein
MGEMPITEARDHLADVIDQARTEPVYLTRRGRPVAVIVDADNYRELLERLEDALDAQDADDARAEIADGAAPVPWEQVKADLGLVS